VGRRTISTHSKNRDHRERSYTGPLLVLAAVCFLRLWLMQLPSSFWVDEMATVFVVEHGAGDPSLKVAPQVPESIYYSVVRAVLAERSEIEYRLPSILFMALALGFVALLASRLIHPDAGWFAIFACFALKGINYEAANARPYAMGMCVAAAGLYFLVRWLDGGRLWDAILFVILAALLWRIHLIFWPFYVVFAICALLRRNDRPRWQIAIVFATVGISLIPVATRALELNSTANLHVVAAQPTWSTVERSLRLMLVVAAALGAWIWSRFATDRPRIAIPASTFALILAWWLWHPLALFAFSRITGNSVFVPRYTGFSLPGTAMAATLAAALFLPSRFWRPAALLLGGCALMLFGQWTEVWPPHHNSDWRGAAAAVNKLALPPSIPVICPSPFIEARPPAWTPDYQMPGFLYAHLLVYPLGGGNVVLFPYAASPEADDYATALLRGAVPAAGRFVIYGSSAQAHFWRDWFEKRSELVGWSHRSLGPFLDVDAVLFER
jgi:Dolichyl-phosphate-mannose-protein mannosyltransferase